MAQIGGQADQHTQEIGDLLGKAGSGLPVWLSPERFLQPDFDADACVADLRRFVPLATLQTELNSYLALLKSKLVEVINEDYSEYVGLAGKLTSLDGAVVRMRRPLLDLKDKLTVVQEAVKTELTALNQGLKRRKEVATARSLLELLQEVAHVASKVEKLLAEVADTDEQPISSVAHNSSISNGHSSSTTLAQSDADGTAPAAVAVDLDSKARLLERVAGEVSRLSFLAARGKDLAFVRNLDIRLSAHRTELEGRLHRALVTALTSSNHVATLHCLHGFVELGLAAPAEEAVRTVVVAPLVARLITEHKQQHPRTGAREDELSSLLKQLLTSITKALGPVLDASLSPHSGLRLLDLLGNAVLEEVQLALAASLPGVFSPGVPPAFHANYLASLQLLDSLEALCQSRGAVDKLRASHAYTTFLKRWNLPVYFSLLYQEVAGDLEAYTSADKLELASGGSSSSSRRGSAGGTHSSSEQPQLAASSSLMHCLQRSVAPEVFLLPLADRFMRLALQLIQRYSSWVAAAVAARHDPAAIVAAPASTALGISPGTSTTSSTAAAQAPASGASPVGAAPASAGTGAPHPMAWVTTLPVEELCLLLHDCEVVARHVEAWLTSALGPLLQAAVPPEVWEASCVVVKESAKAVQTHGNQLAALVSEEVAEKCCGVVKQLKGISATYRMTTKGPPTRHSHYATGILQPLNSLLAAHQVQQLPRSTSEHVSRSVVEAINVRYLSLADELLTTVRKTESSLKRLKKNRPGDAEGDAASAMSDSDKICMQLHLDVQEYGTHISKLGLDPQSMPSYVRLLEFVAPDRQLKA